MLKHYPPITGDVGADRLSSYPWQPSPSPWTTSTTTVQTKGNKRWSWNRPAERTTTTRKSVWESWRLGGNQLASCWLWFRSMGKCRPTIQPSRRWYIDPTTRQERRQRTTSNPANYPTATQSITGKMCSKATIRLPCQQASLFVLFCSYYYNWRFKEKWFPSTRRCFCAKRSFFFLY